MWPFLIIAVQLLAVPTRPLAPLTAYQVLAAEYARGATPASIGVLDAALASGDTVLQRLAVRAIGRMEDKTLVGRIAPMLTSPSASVQRETLNAYGQLGLRPPFAPAQAVNGSVRGAYFATLGRVEASSPEMYATMISALADNSADAQLGAAKGLESLARRTARASRPTVETVSAMWTAFRNSSQSDVRQLLLLALSSSGDRDTTFLVEALRDTSAQVRRLAVMGLRRYVNDVSPMVRYHSVRQASSCGELRSALQDTSEHVQLAAIDAFGDKRCDASVLDALTRTSTNWRIQSHALVALARNDSASTHARAALSRVATSPVWQARTYAANAAKLLKDSATLATLARDTQPNVAIAAMHSLDDALRGLQSNHFGLVLAGATWLQSTSNLAAYQGAIVQSLLRLTARNVATTRDPRVALLQRLHESADATVAARLRPLLRDADPVVAELAAKVMTEKSGTAVSPVTVRYAPAAFPSENTLRALHGATAEVHIRNGGTMVIALLPDEAPVTVATFAALADKGAYNGLTWHRIVPNFVLQGGSPGADEYDGLTKTFLRDEVGMISHTRGSYGVSTRGRDTGDGQIFINLVDNFRLDHDYTVFALTTAGFDIMDRIQEGDVIESITIRRVR